MQKALYTFILITALMLAACGERGDLYLPDEDRNKNSGLTDKALSDAGATPPRQ